MACHQAGSGLRLKQLERDDASFFFQSVVHMPNVLIIVLICGRKSRHLHSLLLPSSIVLWYRVQLLRQQSAKQALLLTTIVKRIRYTASNRFVSFDLCCLSCILCRHQVILEFEWRLCYRKHWRWTLRNWLAL